MIGRTRLVMNSIWRGVVIMVLFNGALAAAEPQPAVAVGTLETTVVRLARSGKSASYDGVVEAVRQTVLAAQVAGAVVALNVKAGDTVKAGQVLARIDGQAAMQATAASDAQLRAARASQDFSTREFERQKQLYQKDYISQAALQRAEAQSKSAQAQVAALIAQSGVARTQSGFFVVQAPYAGIVSEVPVALGDMAMPGRPLVTLYDPAALRVTVAVPQSVAGGMTADAAIKVQLPDLGADREWFVPSRVQLLPTNDVATHTAQLRLHLPPSTAGVKPGMFARVWLPTTAEKAVRLEVPARAVVRRAEMTGLYVIAPDGRPVLRQVRLGRMAGDDVEILSGVSAGERVALDPQAAARIR